MTWLQSGKGDAVLSISGGNLVQLYRCYADEEDPPQVRFLWNAQFLGEQAVPPGHDCATSINKLCLAFDFFSFIPSPRAVGPDFVQTGQHGEPRPQGEIYFPFSIRYQCLRN